MAGLVAWVLAGVPDNHADDGHQAQEAEQGAEHWDEQAVVCGRSKMDLFVIVIICNTEKLSQRPVFPLKETGTGIQRHRNQSLVSMVQKLNQSLINHS